MECIGRRYFARSLVERCRDEGVREVLARAELLEHLLRDLGLFELLEQLGVDLTLAAVHVLPRQVQRRERLALLLLLHLHQKLLLKRAILLAHALHLLLLRVDRRATFLVVLLRECQIVDDFLVLPLLFLRALDVQELLALERLLLAPLVFLLRSR